MPRDIRIQPNRGTTGSTLQPTIYFSGTTAGSINLKVEDDGSITFEGNNGGLFNITDSKDGLLSSVNDVSGLPIFAVYSTDKIIAGGYNQNALIVDNDKVFIGSDTTTVPTGTKLSISGNTLVTGSLSATTLYGNGQFLTGLVTNDFYVTGGTFNSSTNTLTLNRQNGSIIITGFTSGSVTSGGTSGGGGTFTGGTVTGPTNFVAGVTANSLTVSGVTTLYSISANTTPFVVRGKQGELFSVTDSLIGSLFSVSDISGLPILEVYSDNTILMGSYIAPSLNTTRRLLVNAGQSNIYSIPTSAYTGAFFDYTVANNTNLRAGNIMSVWSGNNISYVENSTSDLGNTSGLIFDMVVSSGYAILRASATTSTWTVKTIVRSI